MKRKKILWLCSWYPGKTEPFNGDFIQRHARAAALFNDIYVLHAIQCDGSETGETHVETHSTLHLTEQIIYIKRSNSAWGRLTGYYRWLILLKRSIRDYVKNNGKPNLVHVNIPMKAGLLGLWMKRKYDLPFIVTEHWGIYNEVEKLNYSGRPAAFRHFTKKIFRHAAKFISVSRFLGEGVNKLVTKKEFEVVPNVVNTDLFNYHPASPGRFRFLHVSNMVPLKNAEGILNAFALFVAVNNNTELVMVGDTDPAIRAYAKKIGLAANAIHFRGEIAYQEVAKEMQAAHGLVLFSNIENSPCVIGEALCCGLPVIATHVGGIPELVDASNSILVEPRDEQGLVAAMGQLVNNYAAYNRKKIAELAVGKFSYEVIGKKLDVIYETVINNKP